ncbi:MAG TPA: amino acid ABC transporter permease [Microbacteriaceae bacterium]|nr:amino acid ABC transporter permease [Microbacteriaceae bacterium]
MNRDRPLFDPPGPRARRRIRTLNAVSGAGIAIVLGVTLWAFAARGQLAPDRWSFLTDGAMLQFLGVGLVNTLACASAAALLSFPLGVALALCRHSRHMWLARPAALWIEVFRSVPLLLVILVALTLGPSLGFNPSLFWKLVLAIVLCVSPVVAEVVRAGMRAVPRGQIEAATALGLRPAAVKRLLIVPQALRMMAPALLSQLVAIVKDSTLGYAVGFPELLKQSQTLSAFTGHLIQVTLVVSVMFVLLNLALSRIAGRVAQRARSTAHAAP